MDEVLRKVILSTRRFLEELVDSAALPAERLTEANMAVTALGYQLARADYDPALLDTLHDEEARLARVLRDRLYGGAPASGADIPPLPRKWREGWQAETGAQLARSLGKAGDSGRAVLAPEAETDIAKSLRAFLVRYHEQLDPSVSAGTGETYQGGRRSLDVREPAHILTPERLRDYLRAHVPNHEEVRVTALDRLMGGYSKDTYIADLQHADGRAERIVIRKDGLGLVSGSSVVDEFAILREVEGLGVPVAKPLWLESDRSLFGSAFMAVAFASGERAHLAVPTDRATCRRWSDSLARALAGLHRATRTDSIDLRASMGEEIEILQRRLEERERSPLPGLAFGLSWLTEHLDLLQGRTACRVHGDIGFHNMLMRDDELLVMLDWEYSHVSDPVEDLVYVRPFIDQLGTWPEFLATWERESGFTWDKGAARYFTVWKEARNTVACVSVLDALLIPEVESLAFSLAGIVYTPKYEIATLDAIIDGETHV